MRQTAKAGHDRRSFLANFGVGGGVLALGPLAASIATMPVEAATPGKYDFDTPFNRLGTDSVKWDMPVRTDHMSRIIAGMTTADMDFRCAPSITAALKKRMQHENWGYVDMGSPGPMAFKQGIIDWNQKRYGINNINPKQLAITTGVHSGIICAMRAFAPEGSKVLMATPIYSGFYGDIRYTKTKAEESLMHYVNGRYEIDWDDFERRMTPDVKVSILCNPQNPVGRAWTREELTKYGELCLKHKILVLSDEIHCDFISKGQKYTPFATLDKELVNNSFTFKSGSKSFSLPGMKCAWFFSTNPELFKKAAVYNHADLSTLGMIGEQAAYSGGEDWLNQCVAYIDANHDFANRYIKANIPMLKVGQKPEGTYLAWIDVSGVAEKIGAKRMADETNKNPPVNPATDEPKMVTSEDMVNLWFAQNAYVAMNSGTNYGLGGQNHIRMNLATNRTTLKAALDSMASALKKSA